MLNVCEIFYSIQGEGLFIGKPCVFIRLAGCNLKCSWCDTKYAWNNNSAKQMNVQQILQQIATFNCNLIMVTGGEPLLQTDTIYLLQQLVKENKKTILETNGSMTIENVPKETHISIDLKCPSSQMTIHNNYSNINLLRQTDAVKLVVANEQDINWAIETIKLHNIHYYCHNIIFSPVSNSMNYNELAECLLNLNKEVQCHSPAKPNLPPSASSNALAQNGQGLALVNTIRMQVQLHKIIWPNEERGK